MLESKIDERHQQTQVLLKGVCDKQDKTLANMADHKAAHVGYDRDMKGMGENLAYIKSDKIWLNRIVIGFCITTALAAIIKLLFGG